MDGDALVITGISDPLNGEVVSGTSVITYTPSVYFTGVDEFTYIISDGILTDTAKVVVTVVDSGMVPTAVDDAYTTYEGITLTVPIESGLLANDLDPRGSGLTATLMSEPLNGTLILNADGSFIYVPSPMFRGNDRFTYQVFDGMVYSSVADVIISVVTEITVFRIYLPFVVR